METNYQKPDCECCGRPFEPLHIGTATVGNHGTKQQTIESVTRNIRSLEQLCLNAPSSTTQGIIDAIDALDKLLASLQD